MIKSSGLLFIAIYNDQGVGGYPFEAAKPEAIILPIQQAGFILRNLNTQFGSVGCVEYVFSRTES